jgi:hypothetical protein
MTLNWQLIQSLNFHSQQALNPHLTLSLQRSLNRLLAVSRWPAVSQQQARSLSQQLSAFLSLSASQQRFARGCQTAALISLQQTTRTLSQQRPALNRKLTLLSLRLYPNWQLTQSPTASQQGYAQSCRAAVLTSILQQAGSPS